VDAAGELYAVSLSRGTIIAITGPLTPPATPIKPRVIR